MKKFGTVYILTNMITGKRYVGQTIQSVQYRFRQHCSDKRSGKHLHNSISFYGEENFKIEQLVTCFDQDSLNFYETYFIEYFNTLNPNGYNLCKGGFNKGSISEQTRLKQRQAKLGKKVNRTKRWSEISRLNKSRSQGGKPIVSECLRTGLKTVYSFINQAENDGFNNSEIYRVLSGKRKHHKNHTFYYADQSGSVENNNSPHAQRIEGEPAKAEYNPSTSPLPLK